ncbi:MAG: ABC transporter substrate-binding protein [Burkholderiales bacterium]|nr:ABC transporter substrate-binding protein [Phycisphaerae bacterium]
MPDTPTIQLGHSPDPDDAFMFYAMAQNPPLIDLKGHRFQHTLQDIQTLNQRAMRGELEVSAISIHAFPYVADKYALMSCGSSMGDGYGPMVVTRAPMTIDDLRGKRIAIPGKLTTAYLTLQLCLGRGGEAFDYEVVMFDAIPAAVQSGEFDAGLLIHEGQLTYKKLGLHLVVDLGVWWKEQTGLPLPLGGNVVRKDLGETACQEITDVIRESIQYSLDNRAQAVKYALQFGRDLNHELADEFVGMYVNHWTLDYGQRGREAITRLLADGAQRGFVPAISELQFVTAK